MYNEIQSHLTIYIHCSQIERRVNSFLMQNMLSQFTKSNLEESNIPNKRVFNIAAWKDTFIVALKSDSGIIKAVDMTVKA